MAQQQRDLARSAAVASATRVAERVASDITGQVTVLEAEAASATLDKPDLAAFYAEADRLRQAHHSGRPSNSPTRTVPRSSTCSALSTRNLAPPPTARASTPWAHSPSRDRGIGPVGSISGKRLGGPGPGVPVIREGQLRYVLSVRLATNAVSSVLRDAGAPEGWVGTIVDADGNTIARTQAETEELGHPANAALQAAIRRAPQGFYTGPTLEGRTSRSSTVPCRIPVVGRCTSACRSPP